MAVGRNQPQLPGALADMLLRTYGGGQQGPAPAGFNPAPKMIAASYGMDPVTGLPLEGTGGPGAGAPGGYVDPSTSQIGAADLAKAGGTQAPAAPPGMPKREDFPPGIAGQGKFNQAVIAWRKTAGV